MNFTLLAAYSLSIVTLLLTPGPVVALVTATAAQYGYRRAFITLVGTNGASLILIALAALMLAGVVSISTIWLGVLGLAGSLYIGVMAINGMRGKIPNFAPGARERDNSGLIHGFLTGVANPKDILFFVAFFPQFIAITQDFATSILTLTLVWVIFDVAVLSFYIVIFKRWMPARFTRHSLFISSLFLLAVAIFGVIYNVNALQILSLAN
ncbi:LysE family translocator [Citrobacter europaeus]|uniref:LysE family translocator n=1 Tax=Citrobacter europaeus TaxID=1914243 RepID=UPI00397C0004